MAGIEKLYMNKKDALEFLDYLEKIDDDFKKDFPNASTIFYYVYHDREYWENEVMDESYLLPVSKFPQCVDAWLVRRDDISETVYKKICEHYFMTEGDKAHSLFTEPLVYEEEIHGKKSTHYKVVSRKGVFKHSLRPISNYLVEVYHPMFWWYMGGVDKWTDNNPYNRYTVGLWDWLSSCVVSKSKSYKSLLREIRKWNFPVGTILEVCDMRYVGSFKIMCK